MSDDKIFPPTIEGCSAAIKYLKESNAWYKGLEKMSGYYLVFYANELIKQPNKNDTKPIK
jgi:hypothetical protein